jgi:redox-sensitive bicupin YhaK (pirin superfamily)
VIKARKSASRGRFTNGWLDARFTFSFADYWDAEHNGYSDLLVLNDDHVRAGKGFGSHPHRDIEAISYPLAGEVEHRDSIGTIARMRPGDVQRMTAGRGIVHSEMNASATEPEQHLQFWITPAERNLAPSYEQRTFSEAEKLNRLALIVSPDGRDGSATVHQDARVFASILRQGSLSYVPPAKRRSYLHVARGALAANGVGLAEGDGAYIEDEERIAFEAAAEAEFLLFDLR